MGLRTLILSAAMVAIQSAALPTIVKASVFSDFAGIFTDPLKLAHLSDKVRETALDVLAGVQPLLGRADEMAKERTTDLHRILEDTLAGGAAIEAKTIDDLNKLEAKIMADVDKEIFRTKCAAITILNGTAQEAIAKALAHIGDSNPTVVMGPIPLFRLRFHKVNIDDPDKEYFATKSQLLHTLDTDVNDTTNAYKIISAYANLDLLAEATRCNYLVSVREDIESDESFVIQGRRPDSLGSRQGCGQPRTVPVMTVAAFAIRAT